MNFIRPVTVPFLLLFFMPNLIVAQTVTGRVVNTKKEALTGASIHWLNTTRGVVTDTNGRFEIAAEGSESRKLVARFVGYQSDTMDVSGLTNVTFTLKASLDLGTVDVTGRRDGVVISDMNPAKVEQITQTELAKSACCDLSGCFETQTTVQPQTTNIVTNARELRILGLSGVYNQILLDGFPVFNGLTYTYGISSVPGTLVNSIYIAKGANSVLQGYESISGQINVETINPAETDKMLANAYMNSFGEKQFNLNYAFSTGKWQSVAAAHVVLPAGKTDKDNDTFLDVPRLNRYMIFNKWKYGNESENGWSSTIGVRFLNEKRIGGQTNFNEDSDEGSDVIYGQTVKLNQPEFWSKTGYRINEKNNVVAFVSISAQQQQSWFGATRYEANQLSAYFNLQHEFRYKAHELKSGLSFRMLDLQEKITLPLTGPERNYAGNYTFNETIPGVFAENTLRFFDDKLTWITGVRADNHNTFATTVTPRTLIKYDISAGSVIRASAGTGWRTVKLFSENTGLLASSRDIVFGETLRPERALNYGINFTQKFGTEETFLEGYFSTDFYSTVFQNQIYPDFDADPLKVYILNFSDKSGSNSFQAEINVTAGKRIEIKAGYSFLDAYRYYDNLRIEMPFNSRHKIMAAAGYKPANEKFRIDFNVHGYGPQRLPDTRLSPVEFRQLEFSESYMTASGQFTWKFKKFEVYAGCENIFDFRQEKPIISWQNPFGPYFDTSFAWGPTRGREIYAGLRYRLNNK